MHTFRPRRRIVALILILWLGWTSAAALGMKPLTSERTLTTNLLGTNQPLRERTILLTDGSSGPARQVRTDANGRIRLPATSADSLQALYALDTPPSRRYSTFARGSVHNGLLTFDPAATLMTFPVTISLEWQPGNSERELANLADCGPTKAASSVYLQDVAAAMQSAAAYLYDLTDGQMTFGQVNIYTGGEHWQQADIRILASNDYRPTALVGGIVRKTTPISNADKSLNLTFRPGQIFLGRLWDGSTGRCGPWSASAGARTIVHEWLHYALNLWDEYEQPTSGTATYCATNDLPHFTTTANASSAMAYHYTANALWRGNIATKGDASAPAPCLNTDQMLVHNRSDWETIKFYFPTITMPVGDPLPGPLLTGTIPVSFPPASPIAITSAAVKLTTPISPNLQPASYLIIPRDLNTPGDAASPLPKRIIGQGALGPGGQETFYGVQNTNTARVQLTDPISNTRYAFPKDDRTIIPVKTGVSNQIDLQPSGWQPELHLIPVLNQTGDVIALQVVFVDCAGTAKRVQMVYCPAGGDCGTPVFVSLSASGDFEQVLTPPSGGLLPFYGYVYVRDPERGLWTTTWYQLGGGVGPAHADAHAPMVDGTVGVSVQPNTLTKGEGTATLTMPAQRCFMPSFPQGTRGILGQPLEVQLVRGERGWSPNDPPVAIRLNYNQNLAAQLGVRASDLVLLTFDHTGTLRQQEWQDTPVAGRDSNLGWLGVDNANLGGGLQPLSGRLLLLTAYRTTSGPEQNNRLLLPAVRNR